MTGQQAAGEILATVEAAVRRRLFEAAPIRNDENGRAIVQELALEVMVDVARLVNK